MANWLFSTLSLYLLEHITLNSKDRIYSIGVLPNKALFKWLQLKSERKKKKNRFEATIVIWLIGSLVFYCLLARNSDREKSYSHKDRARKIANETTVIFNVYVYERNVSKYSGHLIGGFSFGLRNKFDRRRAAADFVPYRRSEVPR